MANVKQPMTRTLDVPEVKARLHRLGEAMRILADSLRENGSLPLNADQKDMIRMVYASDITMLTSRVRISILLGDEGALEEASMELDRLAGMLMML